MLAHVFSLLCVQSVPWIIIYNYCLSGVVWSNGDSWKEMRRFALMNLRDYGMGKKACEDKIIEESFYLTEELKKFKGECLYIEISRVVGSRKLQYEDRNNLPFTNAVIHESQRLASILPTSVPHRTNHYHSLFYPKGTVVIPLLASVLHDETEWEKPHSFHPAHFLDKDGKFVKRDAFMPFSAGRRVCLGEGLARMELFLFFATLLQNFRLTPPPGVSEDDLDLTPQLLAPLSPQPYKLCIVPRT
uniref:Cytochrome P450 2K1-like n=1 Tax=Sphaeramia orbicularis TaxID=375764 RepID=A0A673CKQ5_9TELE